MKLKPTYAGLTVALFIATRFIVAAPADSPEVKVTTFLWSSLKSTEAKTELIYHDVKDNYTTRLTFTRDKEFTRSDGIHGAWHITDGKLILTGLDTKDGFTIIFDSPSAGKSELTGRIPKGKWKGHIVLLQLPK
jgi:hypothetical protein